MDLVERVTQTFAVDRAKAEKGVGAVLSALRLSVDKESFEKVKAALPGVEALIGKAMAPGARTAEMAAVVAPSTLLAALASQGWKKEDVVPLARLVAEQVRPIVGDAGVERFYKSAPGLTAK
jgi:uncharacterized protein DUF2267/uncharacterized protein VcgC/VcgE DUF2780